MNFLKNRIAMLNGLLFIGVSALVGCSAGGNDTGIEYAPNMYVSEAYEAYTQTEEMKYNPHGMTMRTPVAGSVAKKLRARRLMIISDVEGVLDNEKKLIPEINSDQAKQMIINGIISGGMIPKIDNCLDVAKNGVKAVCIIDGRKNHSILFELLSDKGSGTLIRE